VLSFPQTSTERAELENFAAAVRGRRPLAVEGGHEEHGVAVLEAILESARNGRTVAIGPKVSPARRRASPRTASRVAAKTKRLLKTVKETLSDAVKKATRGRSKKKTRSPARKASAGPQRRPAQKKAARRK
jgi:hypothetical protein